MKTLLECVVMFAIAAGYSVAAEKSEGNAPQPKDLAWLLGEWEGEYVLPEGVPEIGSAGARIVSRHTWRWTLDRRFIALKIVETIDGKTVSTGEEILGTDQSTGALTHWFFGSTGIHGAGEWQGRGNTWELKWRAYSPGGKIYEAVSDHIRIDDNAYTWQMKNLTENGKPIPDWPKVTYRRRVAAPAGDLWETWRESMVGQWLGSGIIGEGMSDLGITKGDEFAFRLTWTADLGGAALLGRGEFTISGRGYRSEVREQCYWDPQTRQIRLVAVWSDGEVETFDVNRMNGSAFIGTYSQKHPGKPEFRAAAAFECTDDDTGVFRFLDGPSKGQILSTWKRVKKP